MKLTLCHARLLTLCRTSLVRQSDICLVPLFILTKLDLGRNDTCLSAEFGLICRPDNLPYNQIIINNEQFVEASDRKPRFFTFLIYPYAIYSFSIVQTFPKLITFDSTTPLESNYCWYCPVVLRNPSCRILKLSLERFPLTLLTPQ